MRVPLSDLRTSFPFPSHHTSSVPHTAEALRNPQLGRLMAGPKKAEIITCTRKCLPACVRGGEGGRAAPWGPHAGCWPGSAICTRVPALTPGLRHMRCSAAARQLRNTSAGHELTRLLNLTSVLVAPTQQRQPPVSTCGCLLLCAL